ncbi:MAG: hypothetical protein E6K70_22570 [Planctomycetota bacterium]|nr:MAG: hypothetical protein E6K70_22570 [Planctomycetota bacterium]
MAGWLRQLNGNSDLDSFDLPQTGPRKARGFKERADRLHRFLRVRSAVARDDLLQALTKLVKSAHQAGHAAGTVKLLKGEYGLDEDLALEDLITAARPLDGETLVQAEILLRYLLLLSYQGEGVEAVVKPQSEGGTGAVGAEAFFKSTGLPGSFTLSPPSPSDGAMRLSASFVRWNKWPASGHFMQAVADATMSAYRYSVWETGKPKLERLRYQSITDAGQRGQYVAKLQSHVTEIENILDQHLRYYVTSAPNEKDPYGLRRTLQPAVAAPAWTAALTADEAGRLGHDLLALKSQVSSAARAEGLVLQAYRTADLTSVALSLQGLRGRPGAESWNVNEVPTRTFDDYAAAIRRAAASLDKALEKGQWRQALRERFASARAEAEILELDLTTAQLGLQVARLSRQIADTFDQMAKLEGQIRQLATQADDLVKKAKDEGVKSTKLRLTLAGQARDLAAAEVEALQVAISQAEQMVQQAIDSLEAMKPRLLDLANKIEESKKSSFLSILKAIVNVVGVVLAPFTGGVTMTVAQVVNLAIGVYEKVSTLNFSDLGEAVKGIADIANDVDRFFDLSINKLGLLGESGKEALHDVKSWLKKAEGDVKQLSDKAGQLVKGFKNLAQSEVGQLLSALASDIPISVRDGKVQIDLGKAGVQKNLDRLARQRGPVGQRRPGAGAAGEAATAD